MVSPHVVAQRRSRTKHMFFSAWTPGDGLVNKDVWSCLGVGKVYNCGQGRYLSGVETDLVGEYDAGRGPREESVPRGLSYLLNKNNV